MKQKNKTNYWKIAFFILLIIAFFMYILLWSGSKIIDKHERYRDCIDSCWDDNWETNENIVTHFNDFQGCIYDCDMSYVLNGIEK